MRVPVPGKMRNVYFSEFAVNIFQDIFFWVLLVRVIFWENSLSMGARAPRVKPKSLSKDSTSRGKLLTSTRVDMEGSKPSSSSMSSAMPSPRVVSSALLMILN